MTFNRKNQILALEKLYNSENNEAVVYYSSIDSDIHEIVHDFLLGKDYFYYKASPVSSGEQLLLFDAEIREQIVKSNISNVSYASILEAMLSVKCEKRVIVIDEFQNIIKYSTDLINEIIKCVNNKWENQQVFFILLSSNRYFVENQLVEKLNESAYELSRLIKLPDLSFVDLIQYFPKYSRKDLIITYAITGGKAKRIKAFDANLSIKDNIIHNILSEDSFLYNRGFDILPKELREHSVYNTILLNIALGHEKLNELHKITGFSRAKISVYINNLIEHDLIEKIDSYDSDGRENSEKGIYSIKDEYLSFFYRFVYPNRSLLVITEKEKFYKKYIAPYLYDFAKKSFRKVCLEYLLILNKMDKLPIKLTDVGTWVGKVGTIDIIGQDNSGHTLIGLCEFEKDVMTFEDFEWLKFCVSQAKLNSDLFYLFTKKEFDERIHAYAKENSNIFLMDLSML